MNLNEPDPLLSHLIYHTLSAKCEINAKYTLLDNYSPRFNIITIISYYLIPNLMPYSDIDAILTRY